MGLCAYLPSLERFEAKHFWAALVLVLALGCFGWVVYSTGTRLGSEYGPRLEALEASSSP
jgi:hypothetical protein